MSIFVFIMHHSNSQCILCQLYFGVILWWSVLAVSDDEDLYANVESIMAALEMMFKGQTSSRQWVEILHKICIFIVRGDD